MNARATKDGVIAAVYVHPSAKIDRVEKNDEIVVWTREPAEGGRANSAVIKILAKKLGIPRNQISIVRGAATRSKEVYILGIGSEDLGNRL